jgi:membrane protein
MDRLNLSLSAAGVGSSPLLSLFPALAAIVLLWSWARTRRRSTAPRPRRHDVVPGEVYEVMPTTWRAIINTGQQRPARHGDVISLLVALWSARSGVSALIRGLNGRLRHRPPPEHLASLHGRRRRHADALRADLRGHRGGVVAPS